MASSTSYSVPTYKEIIESAYADFGVSSANKIPFNMLRMWINRAQEYLCNRMAIPGRRDLRLIQAQEFYSFADTTNYDGAGTVSSVGTAVTGVSTTFLNTFVPGSSIIAIGAIRKIASVTSDTALVLETAFDSDLAAGTTYKVNGLATEITSEVNDIYYIDRIESNYRRKVMVKNMQFLLDLRRRDGVGIYSSYDTPYVAALDRTLAGRKSLAVYPVPDVDKTITMYCILKIKPRLHTADTIDTRISLEEDYESAIRNSLLFQICRYLKMNKEAADYMRLLEQDIVTLRASIPCKYELEMEYF
jgi:hypothetical protein